MVIKTELNTAAQTASPIKKKLKYTVRLRKQENTSSSTWSIGFSDGIIERAKSLQCPYVRMTVDVNLKEVHVKLCKYPSKLEDRSLLTKVGTYRKAIYARSVILTLQKETTNHFSLMNTYTFKEHPEHSDTFIYSFG